MAQVHGMDGSLVACDWPALTLGALGPLFAELTECGQPVRLLSVSPRPFSSASVIETTLGRVFVKRHPLCVRTAYGLMEEHRFMGWLHQHGAGVPRVYTFRNGATAHEADGWTWEVHEAPLNATANDLYEQAVSWTPFNNALHAYSAGALLAKLHLAAKGYASQKRRAQPLVASFSIFATPAPASALELYLAARPALAASASAQLATQQALILLAPFHAELMQLPEALQPLWTHNDLHASNILWTGKGATAEAALAIDFGLADCTCAVHDLAQMIERNLIEWLTLMNDPQHPEAVHVHYDQLLALLDGYESVRPLSNSEAAALAPMMALCHAEFALTEADYFLTALSSPERAQVAFDDYLIEHAKWFLGSGSALLKFLRTWAADRSANAWSEVLR